MTDDHDPAAGQRTPRFATRAIRAGQPPDPVTGAVIPPVSLSTTFTPTVPGGTPYDYARSGNPTRTALETCLADLEGAAHGHAFASGLAATDAVLRLVPPGGHVIIGDDAYGGTHRLIDRIHRPHGIRLTICDLSTEKGLQQAADHQPDLIWVETPSNPQLRIVDLAGAADAARTAGAILAVDNTFATPYLQNPLVHGAHLVVHSTTKYLGGHSDVVGGFVATSDPELALRIAHTQNAAGAVPGPFDCYLTLRGIKTLAIRMEQHTRNAEHLVELLQDHPKVASVSYPTAASHPQHRTARQQMRGGGGVISITLTGGPDAARRLCHATRLFILAESLGAVESLIEHPASMTHASVAGTALQVDPALVRLSVGIEHVDDLADDLLQALRQT